MRYQVLKQHGEGSAVDSEHQTKAAANKRVRELAKQGIPAAVWDTRDNPLSRMLSL